MSRPLAVVELIGNPRPSSRTRAVADAVTAALTAELAVRGRAVGEPQVLELGRVVRVSFDGSAVPAADGGVQPGSFELVRGADLLVVATPTYKGTYTGLLKVFLDALGPGDLDGVTAVPVAVAASPAHRDAVGTALHTLLVEFGAQVPAPGVALLERELDDLPELAGRWAASSADAIAAAAARRLPVPTP